MRRLVLAAIVLAASPAVADRLTPVGTLIHRAPELPPVAVAVNPPFHWGSAIGVSGYLGVTPHQAIRANVARYEYGKVASEVIGVFEAASDSEFESTFDGTITDLGLSWMYFPRALWNGFFVEAGALRRAANITQGTGVNDFEDTRSTTYAGRALVGWSWLLGSHVFVSLSVGLSVGHESGDGVTRPDLMPEQPHAISRVSVAGEGFVRIGASFGR